MYIYNCYMYTNCGMYRVVIVVDIEEVLKKRGRTIYWLAKKTGLTYLAVSNLCKLKTKGIEFSTLNLICKELECEPGEVLKYKSDSPLTDLIAFEGHSEE
jgi:putative transcriptional regulator